jgi:hypothetical protein
MVIGLSIQAFTMIHVVITLIAIASGLIVALGMIGGHRLPVWTALFLLTTVLTSVTGFMFPINGFTPALGTGAVSLVILAVALFALYQRRLNGAWRWIYIVTAIAALYFNVLVLIIQSFQKVPLFHALAPTQSEAPFLVAQVVALFVFIALGFAAVLRFHPAVQRV